MALLRACSTTALVACVLAAGATPLEAQQRAADGFVHARRLGGSTSLYKPPLKAGTDLRTMAASPGMAADVRTVLRESGLDNLTDAVLSTMANTTSWLMGGECADETPAEGVVVECTVTPGPRSDLIWMAYRPNVGRGDRTPQRMERLRWAGKEPYGAYLFRVADQDNNRIYTFVLPKPCANLSLMRIDTIERAPVGILVNRVCDPATGDLRVTITATGRDIARVQRVQVSLDGQPVGQLVAPTWTFVSNRPGNYTFAATDVRGRPYLVEPLGATVDDCPVPPPPPPPPPPPVVPIVAPVVEEPGGGVLFFLDVLGGKERRERSVYNCCCCGFDDLLDKTYTQCSPMLGLKWGIGYRWANNWELGTAVGVGISLVNDDEKVRHSPVFVDVELNHYIGGAFLLGTGISFWDLNGGAEATPAWLFHVGIPIVPSEHYPIFLLGEGRLFFENDNGFENNYQVWGGLRFEFIPR